MLSTFLMAIAIALIIEGLIPALFPNKWQAYVLKIAKEPVGIIRQMGVIVAFFGIILFWLVK